MINSRMMYKYSVKKKKRKMTKKRELIKLIWLYKTHIQFFDMNGEAEYYEKKGNCFRNLH